MEAKSLRQIASGAEYERYFPRPNRRDPIVKRDASVFDTVDMAKRVVQTTLTDTRSIAEVLRGRTLRETCSNIWHFVYRHIRYRRDKPGVEQVRRPARAWADRRTGVDCDCYTVFISSILINLGISHTYRITEYASKGYFQHIYPVVLAGQGSDHQKADKQITLDCVKDAFDAEEPYTKKKDYRIDPTDMDMQYLDGLGEADDLAGEEFEGLSALDDYFVDGLGRVRKRRGRKVAPDGPTVQQVAQATASQAAAAVVAQPMVQTSPGADPTIRTATYTINKGRLRDGTIVELSDQIRPGSEKRYPWAAGRVMAHRKVLFNGVWDGHSYLDRFVVRNGILRGVNVDGFYYTTDARGPLRKVAGVRIANPAVPLAGIPGEDASQALYTINGLGQVVRSDVPSAFGLYISYPVLLELWRTRQTRITGAQGLEGLASLLGDGAETILSDAAGLGDFEADGLDDVAGLAASTGIGLIGLQDVGSLAALDMEPVFGLEGDDALLVMDGLGRLKRARVRRNRSTNPQPNVSIEAKPATATIRHLGLYVPLNTLRNLLKLRGMAVSQMAAGGKMVSPGQVPQSVDGVALSGSLNEPDLNIDGLGWAFGKKLAAGAAKVTAIASPVARLVPGLAPVAALSKLSTGILQRAAGGGGRIEQTLQRPLLNYEQRYGPEAMMAYGSEVDGLREVPGKVVGFVKRNPAISVIGIAGLGWTIYRLAEGKAVLPGGLSGTASPKRKRRSKKAKSGKAVQRFSMISLG